MEEDLEEPVAWSKEEEGKEEVVAVLQAYLMWHESLKSVLFPTLLEPVSHASMSPSCLVLLSLPIELNCVVEKVL